MRSSSLAAALAIVLSAPLARAQASAEGFAVERLVPSAPGAGWFVMDDLSVRGGLGGAVALEGGYARRPLRLSSGLPLVSHEAFADLGLAVTYERFRGYLDLAKPMIGSGQSGFVGGYALTAPSIDAGKAPDLFSDVRLGFDTRIAGGPDDAFRLGLGAQLFVPSGERASYVTDDTYRAMARVLFAGDVGWFTYAAHVGVHVRPLDDAPAPGSPHGSEVLFGVAAGPKLDVARDARVVVGPEIWGATAARGLLSRERTGVEGLVSARVEGTRAHGPALRLKLGAGAGLHAEFGAPEWRSVIGVEVVDRGGRAASSTPE
jgi:OOP family OmpA-OmpF porin